MCKVIEENGLKIKKACGKNGQCQGRCQKNKAKDQKE